MSHRAAAKAVWEFVGKRLWANAGKAALVTLVCVWTLWAPPSEALDLDARLDDTARNNGPLAMGDGWFYVGTDVDGRTLTIRYRVPVDIRPDDGMVRIICQDSEMRDLIEAGATVRVEFVGPADEAIAAFDANAERCHELARAIDAEFGRGWAFAPERVHRALNGHTLQEALARIASSISNWPLNKTLTLVWANSENTTINLHVSVDHDEVEVDANEILKNICRDQGMGSLIAAGATFRTYFVAMQENPERLPSNLTIIAAADCDRLSAAPDAMAPFAVFVTTHDEFIRNTFRKLVWQQIGTGVDTFRIKEIRSSPDKGRAYVYEFSGNPEILPRIDHAILGAGFCAHRNMAGLFRVGGLVWLIWQNLNGEELANIRVDSGYCDRVPADRRQRPDMRHPRGEMDDMIERFVVASANAQDALSGLRTVLLDPELPTVTSIHRIADPGNMQALRAKQIRNVCGDPAIRRQIDRGVVAEYVLQHSYANEYGVITVDSEICRSSQ